VTGLRLVLARHGQTPSNVRMALDSAPPGPPLTEQGRRQAIELAEDLAGQPVVAVYASTALRAQQTAEPVAGRHGLAVEVVDGIQEVFVGDLEGRHDEDSLRRFFTVFSAWAAGDLSASMPGGESGQQVVDRYREVIDRIGERHAHGVAVLVSHGAAIRLVAPTLAANIAAELGEHALIPNTGRVVLDAEPTGWRCVAWPGIKLV